MFSKINQGNPTIFQEEILKISGGNTNSVRSQSAGNGAVMAMLINNFKSVYFPISPAPFIQNSHNKQKKTGETPEVPSDKRKPREEREGNRRKRIKRGKRRKRAKKHTQPHCLIFIL